MREKLLSALFTELKPVCVAINVAFQDSCGPLYHFHRHNAIDQEIALSSYPNSCSICCSLTELPALQSARYFLDVEWLSGGKVFAVGGVDNDEQPMATVEMLECSWDTEESANGGWRYLAPINHTRWLHAVAFIRGKIIAAGGKKRESKECFTLPNVDFPQGQWVLLRPMTPPTLLAGLHPFGDYLLFVGKC